MNMIKLKKKGIVQSVADHGMPGLLFLLLPYSVSTTLHLGSHFSTSLVKKNDKNKQKNKTKGGV